MEDQREEKFEDVVFYYQTFGLEKFCDQAQAKGYDLDEDFTLESLDELERYIREQRVRHDSKDKPGIIEFISSYYYLGEVFSNTFGGRWKESDTDKNSVYYGQPVITEYRRSNGMEFCPRIKLISLINGRLKQGLRKNIELITNYKPNLSALDSIALDE